MGVQNPAFLGFSCWSSIAGISYRTPASGSQSATHPPDPQNQAMCFGTEPRTKYYYRGNYPSATLWPPSSSSPPPRPPPPWSLAARELLERSQTVVQSQSETQRQ